MISPDAPEALDCARESLEQILRVDTSAYSTEMRGVRQSTILQLRTFIGLKLIERKHHRVR